MKKTLFRKWERCKRYLIQEHLFTFLNLVVVLAWVTLSELVYFYESQDPRSDFHDYFDALWYGLVTILTVGYGDFVPHTVEGRLIGSVLMIVGIGFIGIITAWIASEFLQRSLVKRGNMVRSHELEDHFIICGWKDEMPNLLQHIFNSHNELDINDVVIIAPLPQSILEEFREDTKFGQVPIIIGNHFQRDVLRKARPDKAQKILILADRTPNEIGNVPTIQEADARTIMAANAISKICGHSLITAEIIDGSLAEHLRMAGVSDIIFSRDYSRLLLGKASVGAGISNVIYDLLNPLSGTNIRTKDIPREVLGKTYGDLSKFEQKHASRYQLIGVIRNSGNPYHLKDRAIREAQKTSDVSVLISNLRQVKDIAWNQPVFNPPPDTPIDEGMVAIIIEQTPSTAA